MKRTIKVTESNIRLGRKNLMHGHQCIIFRALRRNFKNKVEYCGFSYFILQDGRTVQLPETAKNMQRTLMGEPNIVIKPFSFTVSS